MLPVSLPMIADSPYSTAASASLRYIMTSLTSQVRKKSHRLCGYNPSSLCAHSIGTSSKKCEYKRARNDDELTCRESRVCSVVENAPDDICVCGVQGPVNFNRVIQFAVVMVLTARVSLFVASELVMAFLKEILNPLLESAECCRFATDAELLPNSDLWPCPNTRVGDASGVRSAATCTSDADVVGAELSGSLRSIAQRAMLAALVSSGSICGNACGYMHS